MDELTKQRLKAIKLLTIYCVGLYHARTDTAKIEVVNDSFDARAAMTTSSSFTGVSIIVLNPYTVVERQIINLTANYAADHGTKELTYSVNAQARPWTKT